MNDLFKKINTLVKASVTELWKGNNPVASRPETRTSSGKLIKDFGAELKSLRQRINDALDYQDKLQVQVDKLQAEVETWDQKADEAVSQANVADSRHAVMQLQRTQQRLSIAVADLREHQFVTQDLIQNVNMLETVVDSVHQEDMEQSGRDRQLPSGQTVQDIIQDIRKKISGLGVTLSSRDLDAESSGEDVPEQVISDDLARRRERLSRSD